jgi:hypothetical protein
MHIDQVALLFAGFNIAERSARLRLRQSTMESELRVASKCRRAGRGLADHRLALDRWRHADSRELALHAARHHADEQAAASPR